MLSDAEVIRYVEEVCGAFSDAAFLHYNTATTRRLVAGSLYRELVARVPNLVATKTMTGDLGVVAGVVREAPELMHFLTEQSVGVARCSVRSGLLGRTGDWPRSMRGR